VAEDAAMKVYRLVSLFAAVLAAVLLIWALGHEHIGAQEEQSIEAAAP
jgi:hypothetical protein